MKAHNKRRNVGLMYEFLIRSISSALVEGDERRQRIAVRILKRYFRPGTELHREFRILNALHRTTVSTPQVAAMVLAEAKEAIRGLDEDRLTREKTLLIKEIARTLHDDEFYSRHVSSYRALATVQSLFNEWRRPSGDIAGLAKCQEDAVGWLTEQKVDPDVSMGVEDPATTRVLSRVLTKKLNEKYTRLNEQQKALIRTYTMSQDTEEGSRRCMLEAKDRLLTAMSQVTLTDEGDVSRLAEVRTMLTEEVLERIDDDTVVRFMMYMRVMDDLTGGLR